MNAGLKWSVIDLSGARPPRRRLIDMLSPQNNKIIILCAHTSEVIIRWHRWRRRWRQRESCDCFAWQNEREKKNKRIGFHTNDDFTKEQRKNQTGSTPIQMHFQHYWRAHAHGGILQSETPSPTHRTSFHLFTLIFAFIWLRFAYNVHASRSSHCIVLAMRIMLRRRRRRAFPHSQTSVISSSALTFNTPLCISLSSIYYTNPIEYDVDYVIFSSPVGGRNSHISQSNLLFFPITISLWFHYPGAVSISF